MGNPFVKELLLGLSVKDRFDRDQPKKDAQFASYFADPFWRDSTTRPLGEPWRFRRHRGTTCSRFLPTSPRWPLQERQPVRWRICCG
jgi:Domain of unknown function (DUF4331)